MEQFPGNGFNKETEDAIYFYTPAFDALNNFSAHTVELWGTLFPTAEHAFQWKKFSEVDRTLARHVLEAAANATLLSEPLTTV